MVVFVTYGCSDARSVRTVSAEVPRGLLPEGVVSSRQRKERSVTSNLSTVCVCARVNTDVSIARGSCDAVKTAANGRDGNDAN